MEIDELDIEFPSFRSSSATVVEEKVPEVVTLPVKENKPVEVVTLPITNATTVTVRPLQSSNQPKENPYAKFNELNIYFAESLGWTITSKENSGRGIPPLGYGAPFSEMSDASKKREEIAIPKYTKDISAIWDSIFLINKNNPEYFEFEFLTNWDSQPNAKNEKELYHFMTVHLNMYFNKMRKFIYDIPLNNLPTAFCLLFTNLNNIKTDHLESFFKLKVEPINFAKK